MGRGDGDESQAGHEDEGELAVDLEVFPEGGGMCVGLVAASDPAVVGLVGGVHVHVLLPVARVGKTSVTALDLALEWFLA